MALGEIKKIVRTVRSFAMDSNRKARLDENQVNDLLDTIIDFKKALAEKTKELEEINERMEQLANYNKLNDQYGPMVKDVVISARNLYSSLICQYVSMNSIKKRGIAKSEINTFKDSILKLKDYYQHLEDLMPESDSFTNDYAQTT